MNLAGLEKQGTPDHRWQFQGQEKQEEFDLNWISFKWRNHDPTIGRFFNVDPLAEDYVHNSPYAFAENKVISYAELEGLEGYFAPSHGGQQIMNESTKTAWESRFDKNRESVHFLSWTTEAVGGGVFGLMGGASYEVGDASDKHGFTMFTLTGADFEVPHLEENGVDWALGFDVDGISIETAWDWKNSSFLESVTDQGAVEVSLVEVDISFRDGYFGIGGGAGKGAGIGTLNVDGINSISIGHGESEQFIKYHDKWNGMGSYHEHFKVNENSDNKSTGTLMFQGENTGIQMFRRGDLKNDKMNIWESKSYRDSFNNE